jgi:hypothetical protein
VDAVRQGVNGVNHRVVFGVVLNSTESFEIVARRENEVPDWNRSTKGLVLEGGKVNRGTPVVTE